VFAIVIELKNEHFSTKSYVRSEQVTVLHITSE